MLHLLDISCLFRSFDIGKMFSPTFPEACDLYVLGMQVRCPGGGCDEPVVEWATKTLTYLHT